MDDMNEESGGGLGTLGLIGCPVGLALVMVMAIVAVVVGGAVLAFALGG